MINTFITFHRFCKNFFERLMNTQNVSPRTTISSYRDTFRLLLKYMNNKFHKSPSSLTLDDLNPQNILSFLNYLEKERKNSIQTRNVRLAAIRSFLQFSSYFSPTSLSVIKSVLSIPMKRFDRPIIGFLSKDEINSIIDAPDVLKWCGR